MACRGGHESPDHCRTELWRQMSRDIFIAKVFAAGSGAYLGAQAMSGDEDAHAGA